MLSTQTDSSPFRFTEMTKESGIDFVHFSGMTKDKRFPTANGSGAALLDIDNDGKLDLYFATATELPLGTKDSGPNRLFRNLGDGKFRDETESSGLGFRGFCHGIIVGDIDNDGDADVFLATYRQNTLFRNNGDGTFEDVTAKAGLKSQAWSSGGAFFDADNDGDLDLYVSNYGDWEYPRDDTFCGDKAKNVRLYCSPRTIRTVKHLFYRNNGDGTFTEAADAAGFSRSDGHGFGVVAADLNGDGRTDLYVANDMNPNFLYLNKGDGTFEDLTEISGAAFDERGQAQSGMGVDAEDVNGDGRPDLFVTNFANEYNTLYDNLAVEDSRSSDPKALKTVAFLDTTAYVGLAADSMPWVGWGCALADWDSDGWPDVFVSNGHVDDNRKALGQEIDYDEPALLFRNVSTGDPDLNKRRFKLATKDAGAYFDKYHVGRGAAFGDIDGDGDIDIVLNHKDQAASVLRNDTPRGDNRFLRLKLVGTKSNRDAIGARVEILAGDRTIFRQRKSGGSLESSNDPFVVVGLGACGETVSLIVRWPSGRISKIDKLSTNQTHEIVEPSSKEGA